DSVRGAIGGAVVGHDQLVAVLELGLQRGQAPLHHLPLVVGDHDHRKGRPPGVGHGGRLYGPARWGSAPSRQALWSWPVKAVILAGGRGTRFSEETGLRPKPMVEIGGRPILWHVMKLFSARGVNDFVICLGYRGYVIKEFFANYYLHSSDVTFDVRANRM